MLHLLFETGDGNRELKGKRFPLGENIRKHLITTLQNYKGDKSIPGYKRLCNIIEMDANDGGIAYNEMKRIKNFFDNYNGTEKSSEYILNGGTEMYNWIRNTLNTAIENVEGVKQAKKIGGIDNSFRKKHTKDRVVKPTKTKIRMSDINRNLLNVANSGFKITKMPKVKGVVNESFEDLFYDNIEDCCVYNIFAEFKHRKTPQQKISWEPRITPQQYQNALYAYMQYGDAMRFPEKYIDEWLSIIMHNTAKLEQCTEIAGHSTGWCDEDFEDAFGDEYREWCEKNGNEYEINYSNCSKFLDDIGFYDFLEMPDGSDAWSDYGLNPLYEVLREYRDDMTPGEKLILVNRCLDIGHQRGDLASIFIEGGSKTCNAISNGGYQNVSESRTFYLNEEQLKKFKHIVLENTNKSEKIDLDSLPSVIELGDGVYKGMIKGHVFTYNGEKYKTSVGLKNMFPQPWSIQIKNGIETNL